MEKIVCYCASRKIYQPLSISIKSLLINNTDINKVYLFIEDDVFPYVDSNKIIIKNLRKLPEYINKVNNNTKAWNYMALIRLVLSKYLNEDKILYLDYDTIVDKNIDELFNLNLENYYIAAVEDSGSNDTNWPYINSGVLLMNLKKIRAAKLDDVFIKLANTEEYACPDQDILHICCKEHQLILSANYNDSMHTKLNTLNNSKIIHFAGYREWWNLDYEFYKKEVYEKYLNI